MYDLCIVSNVTVYLTISLNIVQISVTLYYISYVYLFKRRTYRSRYSDKLSLSSFPLISYLYSILVTHY